jgi:Cdc6-like AAA superfamily ATPase
MFATKIFPGLIILLSISAAIVYAVKGDARHAIYWLSAAVLNMSVTY